MNHVLTRRGTATSTIVLLGRQPSVVPVERTCILPFAATPVHLGNTWPAPHLLRHTHCASPVSALAEGPAASDAPSSARRWTRRQPASSPSTASKQDQHVSEDRWLQPNTSRQAWGAPHPSRSATAAADRDAAGREPPSSPSQQPWRQRGGSEAAGERGRRSGPGTAIGGRRRATGDGQDGRAGERLDTAPRQPRSQPADRSAPDGRSSGVAASKALAAAAAAATGAAAVGVLTRSRPPAKAAPLAAEAGRRSPPSPRQGSALQPPESKSQQFETAAAPRSQSGTEPEPPSPTSPSHPAAAAAAALRQTPDFQAPHAPQPQSPGGLVALPEGVYPTFVPRNPGIRDGEWNANDLGMVQRALRDADDVLKAGKVGEPGFVLLGSEPEELEALAERFQQPRFRAQQLMDAVMKGARSVEEMSTIPKSWRQQLLESGVRTGRSLIHHSVGDEDGTRKFLLQLHDGRIVETVGIPTEDRLTVCVSSQVGCPMRCTFCATGKGGFARNLAPHEIVDQVLTVQEQFGRRVSNVVFMGMGEPLLNLKPVLRSYQVLNKQLGIGGAYMTISTVGVPNAISRLAEAPVKATLAVSLHAPTQELRETIIPSAKAYPLDALMNDCAAYCRRTNRRITFEYTLLSGVNDGTDHARQLADLLRRHALLSHVNVIPWNPVDDSTFQRPSRNRVFAFKRAVEAAGLECTIRETRGLEAAAACGQLRNRFQKQPLPEFQVPL